MQGKLRGWIAFWRRFGTPAVLLRLLDRVAGRVLGLRIIKVVWLDRERLSAELAPPPGFVGRFLSPDEVRRFAANPVYELMPELAQRIESRRDFCFGAMTGDRLACYVWYALGSIEPEHALGVAMSYPAHVAYTYKGFTHPDYRGRRLYPFTVAAAMSQLAPLGVTRLVAVVEWTNWASWRSMRRMGFECLGHIVRFGWGKAALWLYPREPHRRGVQLGPHARGRAPAN